MRRAIHSHGFLMPKSTVKCADYSKLEDELTEILEELRELTARQIEIFHSKDYAAFIRLDKKLENMVGKKERSVGALRQHAKEHGCQPVIPD